MRAQPAINNKLFEALPRYNSTPLNVKFGKKKEYDDEHQRLV
jgi:hypothetical protein